MIENHFTAPSDSATRAAEPLSYEDWYIPMLRLCISMVDELHGKSVNDEQLHLIDAHSLAKKTVVHLISLHRLCAPTSLKAYERYATTGTSGLVDHASASVLLRAALEAYLTFSYLYLNNESEEVRARRISWKIGALSFRQGLEPINIIDNQKKIDEGQRLKALHQALCDSAYFNTLRHTKRNKLKIGRWDFGLSWADLAVMAGFDRQWFDKLYRYLCAYAHSGYLTTMQINTASNMASQRQLADFSLCSALPLMSKFILRYPALFPETIGIRNCSPFAFRASKIYDFGAAPSHSPHKFDDAARSS